MTLYQKVVSKNGKVTYKEYTNEVSLDLDNKQMLMLAATIGTCCLIGLEQHLPNHSALSRKIRDVENSIMSLSSLCGTELDSEMITVGTGAWGAAMEYLADHVNVND